MDLSHIVSELKNERNRIDRAIAALNGLNGTGTQGTDKTSSVKAAARTAKHRGHLTAEGRKRLSEMMGGTKEKGRRPQGCLAGC